MKLLYAARLLWGVLDGPQLDLSSGVITILSAPSMRQWAMDVLTHFASGGWGDIFITQFEGQPEVQSAVEVWRGASEEERLAALKDVPVLVILDTRHFPEEEQQ